MRRLVLAFVCLGLAIAARPAAAAGCVLGQDLVPAQVPLGCPIVYSQAMYETRWLGVIHAIRGNSLIDVTGPVTVESTNVAMAYHQFDCDGSVVNTTYVSQPYEIVSRQLAVNRSAARRKQAARSSNFHDAHARCASFAAFIACSASFAPALCHVAIVWP